MKMIHQVYPSLFEGLLPRSERSLAIRIDECEDEREQLEVEADVDHATMRVHSMSNN